MNPKSKKLKIIFVGRYNSDEVLTGPEKVAKRIYSGLQGETDSVFIEYFFDGSKFSIWQKLFGKEKIIGSQNHRIFRLGIVSMFFFTVRFRPYLVHIFSFERFSVIFFMLKIFLRYKISYTINGIVAFENSNFQKNISLGLSIKDRIAEWFLMKFSDKLFFLSEKSINIARKYYNVVNEKIILTTNGVDEIFNQVFIGRQYNEKAKLNVVLVADSIRLEKGLDFLLKSIQPIQNEFNFNLIGNSLFEHNLSPINQYPKM